MKRVSTILAVCILIVVAGCDRQPTTPTTDTDLIGRTFTNIENGQTVSVIDQRDNRSLVLHQIDGSTWLRSFPTGELLKMFDSEEWQPQLSGTPQEHYDWPDGEAPVPMFPTIVTYRKIT